MTKKLYFCKVIITLMKMDQPGIERALQLLVQLAHNHFTTNAEFCKRFGFSLRTFYRYIATFRNAGLVVKKNDHRVLYLETSNGKLSNTLKDLLFFTKEEETVLYEAIDSIVTTTAARENLKKKLYAVYDYQVITDAAFSRKDQKTMYDLKLAIDGKKQVVLKKYKSSNSGTIKDRQVEPYAFTDAKDQVWCYEIASKSVKLFKISRIDKVDVLETIWKHENAHLVGRVDMFRMHSTESFHICLRLSQRAANLLQEEYPLSKNYLAKIQDNRYILDADVCGFEGVSRFVLGLYDEIEVVESKEFKDYLNYKVKMMKQSLQS